ncbi:MAG TPA: tRNA 2-thiouridine(34) synthase MnmA [Thermomicrobiales bacterium]|nr:tRNA 2-thiouridine(34) synthase MnmA [Thermomicrobiales bacterium]
MPTSSATSITEIDHLLSPELIGPHDGVGRLAVVAMSGGVDSAVTALVMRERGYRVVGMNLRLFSPADPVHSVNPCCGIPAMDDARATCQVIGVPFYAINMEAEFGEAVINRFVDEYAAGRTPNPCLECNRHVKFTHLVHRARLLGADCLATGHYARIEQDGDRHRLFRAIDDRKDQSYVLHTLSPDQLAFIQFPLGRLTKPQVRTLARHFGLPVADKEESQEICFVGKSSYADFVAKRRPDVTRPGEIVNEAGDVLGAHDGLVHHTVGQRRGIRIAGPSPLYVLHLDTVGNRLTVGPRDHAVARTLLADGISFTDAAWPDLPFDAMAVVRYRGVPTQCRVVPGEKGMACIELTGDAQSLPVASPGQAVVFYRNDEVLGGGTIRTVEREANHVGHLAKGAQ